MVLTRRHAASPSLDARPPRPWGGRSSRQSPWFAFRASVSSVGLYGRNYSKTMKFKLLCLYAKKINCEWPIKFVGNSFMAQISNGKNGMVIIAAQSQKPQCTG